MIIYTVITNQYDKLREPWVVTPGWEYICFSDQPLQSKVWEIREIENTPGIDRYMKIKAHEYFDDPVVVWIDGNCRITSNLNSFISAISTVFSLQKHPYWNCIYKEAELLLKRNWIDSAVWKKQKERYQQEGFPEEWMLGSNNILVRDLSDPKVQAINDVWWEEYKTGAKRDQLSLMYCFWKAGWAPDIYPRGLFRYYFRQKKHANRN